MIQHRRHRVAVSLTIAAGGMLAAAMGHVATAPSAHADINDIINAIDGSLADGYTAFTSAATDFSSNEIPKGLALSFAGLDDYLLAPGSDLAYNGYAALQGVSGSYTYFFYPTPPADPDLPTAIFDATPALTTGNDALGTALTDFGSNQILNGITYLNLAMESFVEASQTELIGLIDGTFGL